MACSEQKIWGYETSWGSFAQFTKVQAQQLVQKPKQLGWEEAASYGLTYFTAYRMLVGRAQVKPGDNVLVWGAAGGLGIFAIQICKILGANPIAVVSSPDKYDMVRVARRRAASSTARTSTSPGRPNETPERTKKRMDETKRLGAELRKLTGGKDPDVIFEHVGQETFPRVGVLVQALRQDRHLRRDLAASISTFDVRYLWMRQKEILGSHFANAYQAERANELVIDRQDQAGARSGVRLHRDAAGAPADEREQAQGQARHPHPGAEPVVTVVARRQQVWWSRPRGPSVAAEQSRRLPARVGWHRRRIGRAHGSRLASPRSSRRSSAACGSSLTVEDDRPSPARHGERGRGQGRRSWRRAARTILARSTDLAGGGGCARSRRRRRHARQRPLPVDGAVVHRRHQRAEGRAVRRRHRRARSPRAAGATARCRSTSASPSSTPTPRRRC